MGNFHIFAGNFQTKSKFIELLYCLCWNLRPSLQKLQFTTPAPFQPMMLQAHS